MMNNLLIIVITHICSLIIETLKYIIDIYLNIEQNTLQEVMYINALYMFLGSNRFFLVK